MKRDFSLRLMYMRVHIAGGYQFWMNNVRQAMIQYQSDGGFNRITSWLVLYPHLGKAALDIGTRNELCWKMAHRQIISFEPPNLWLAVIKKIGLNKYNNKPLQNTNKDKPDHFFFCYRSYKARCVVRNRKCIFSKQLLLKTSLDRSFVNNSQQKLWLDATFSI